MTLQKLAGTYYAASRREATSRVDRMMGYLLILEWLGIVAAAALRAPFTWEGPVRHLHPHFLAALLAGPLIIAPAVAVAFLFPGRVLTRHVVAAAQMIVSVVLIDVTGGRIESHFHIFGSLAFLAAYRDWRVLITASAVTGVDHFVAGIWWPLSVYGQLTSTPLRFLEHVWWVVFEDFFLILTIRGSVAQAGEIALGKAKLYEGAYHDVLTGLGNRRLLVESWDRLVQESPIGTKAVLFIDLDRFKQVNDIHGHTIGDKLLSEVAVRLNSCFPEPAVLARIGGDEFVVLLDAASLQAVRHAGSGALEALNHPFSIEGHQLLLSATVGVALYPENGDSLPVLQERADQAMYAAKANGRNQVNFFSMTEQARADAVSEVTRDLFQALGRREFEVHFQPLISRTGEIQSMEALLRWFHPRQGSIAPAEFIPMAERTGLIIPIGVWVLAEACRQCVSWQRAGSERLSVGVNISPVQFKQKDFPALVESVLRETGLGPRLLTLELTESVLIEDFVQARVHLQKIRAMGVQIALDDFGTGYSSLTYLAELPADGIKLDRAFVQNQLGKASSILQSIVEMAHRIGLYVVAEGVENGAEAERLLNLDCDILQGFQFSKPLPARQVPEFLEARAGELVRSGLFRAKPRVRADEEFGETVGTPALAACEGA